jgi:EpsI family protein
MASDATRLADESLTAGARQSDFFRHRGFQILTLVLVLHSVAFYSLSSAERTITTAPLTNIPSQFGPWTKIGEFPIDPEVQAVLRADDTVNRSYAGPSGESASLFVAFFKTQTAGKSPHSPKHCMPGSGWSPASSGFLKVNVPSRPDPIEVNRYVIARGEQKSLVLYWYQSSGRVVASEYWSKFYLVLDSIRHRRSDVAMVRVIVPVRTDEAAAEKAAIEFVRDSFVPIEQVLPS